MCDESRERGDNFCAIEYVCSNAFQPLDLNVLLLSRVHRSTVAAGAVRGSNRNRASEDNPATAQHRVGPHEKDV